MNTKGLMGLTAARKHALLMLSTALILEEAWSGFRTLS